MNKCVDKVIYINLAERPDRKNSCLKILNNLFDKEKIMRFEAIKHKKGYIGCLMSHIECLNIAIENNWNNVLIVEDDINYTEESQNILVNLTRKPFDVIILGGTLIYYNPFNYNLYKCNTTTAYIVSNKYLPILKSIWNEDLKKLIRTDNYYKYSADKSWNKLQYRDNWKIVYPPIFIQKLGESDIINGYINYEKYFYTVNFWCFIREFKKIINKSIVFLFLFLFLFSILYF